MEGNNKKEEKGQPVPLTQLLAEPPQTRQAPAPAGDKELAAQYQLVRNADLYRILGVGANAGAAELKDAYFRLMSKFHPDLFFETAEPQKLEIVELVYKRITISYEILSDAESRRAYDLFLAGKLPRPPQFTRLGFIEALRQLEKPADVSELEFHDIINRKS